MMISNVKNLLITLLLALGLALGGLAPAIAADGDASHDGMDAPVVDKDGDKDDGEEWTEEDEYGW